MIVKLLHHTPLEVADIAICKCYGNEPHSDSEKVKARINRVANVSKHSSVVEHISYSLDIDGISRSCLIELSRHRIASYTVKSSRYTLQELKKEQTFDIVKYKSYYGRWIRIANDGVKASKYIVLTGDKDVDNMSILALENVRRMIQEGKTNDIAKYCMPECFKTSLVMTINARSLQNFLELRSSKHALWEIQLLAKAMYEAIPDEHKFLYDNIFKEDIK